MDKTTLGESRVTVKYSSDSEQALKIQRIRDISASLIDFLNEDKISRTTTTTCPLDGETARVYAQAMTQIEDSCMWAIKAICK